MAKYAMTGRQTAVTATPGDTAASLACAAASPRRIKLYDFTNSFGGTPADNAIQVTGQKHTADGTGDAIVPLALDPADPASTTIGLEEATVEPTYTAAEEFFDQIINQRATYRWVAFPGGEILVAATVNIGLGIVAFHASYTGSHEVTMHFEEM